MIPRNKTLEPLGPENYTKELQDFLISFASFKVALDLSSQSNDFVNVKRNLFLGTFQKSRMLNVKHD